MKSLLKRINWVNTLFLLFTTLIALIGTPLLIIYGFVHWPTWILAGVLTSVMGVSVTAGYHRLLSHKSYKAHGVVRAILLLLCCGVFEGSALEWCTDHRNHHRYTDTEKDPYNIKQGFWHAHIGWLITLDTSKRDFSNVADLQEDPLLRLQHQFFVPLSLLIGFVLPTVIASLWGDALAGFVIAGVLRVVVNHQFTFCINSVCHMFGKRTYSDQQSARDQWFTALFTFGEGFHNFHHQFPIDYRNGIRAYHFDPTKWLIRGLSYLGLTTDLKRVPQDRIDHYEKSMKQKTSGEAEAPLGQRLLTQLEDAIAKPSLDTESV